MAQNDVFLLAVNYTMEGQTATNVIAVRQTGATDLNTTNLGVLADAFKETFRPYQGPNVTWTTWRATKVYGTGVTYSTSAPFRVSLVSLEAAHTGTLTGQVGNEEAEVLQVAALVRCRTGFSSRRKRGRWYIGGIAENQLQNGKVLAASLSGMQTAANSFANSYGSGNAGLTLEIGVWSDRTAKNTALSNTWPRVETSQGAPSPQTAFEPITSLVVEANLKTQRRRAL